MTRTDEPIQRAIRRADVGWLSDHLDAQLCTPAVFARLVRHKDPRLRYLSLVLLTERVTSGRPADGPEMAELAGLLPESVAGTPEAALVLAGLYERLGPHAPGRRRPSWRTAELPVGVQIAWLRADLLNEPAVIREEPPSELLYQAVRGTRITSTHRPHQLVAELVGSGDPVLQAEALRLARQGLHAGLLAPALVRGHLTGLLDSGSSNVVTAALSELGEPWAALTPLPPGLLSPFLTSDAVSTRPEPARAALTAAAHHGHGDVLRQAIENTDLPPDLRRRAMRLLGDLAQREDIGELTAIAAHDPLLLGGPLVTCLRGLHRRGHFPDEQDAPAIVGLALADHSIPSREVATVLFTCRQTMFRVLVDVAADNPSWPRRLALLVALAGQGAAELPIGEAITRVLPLAPAPGPFLDAIRELRHTQAEDAVLACLPSAPAAVLDTLEAIGGRRTVAALTDGLGLTVRQGTGLTAPHLFSVRNRALELLWHLTDDPAQRRGLLARLDPTDLPARVAADLGGPDAQELALLRAHLDPDEPVAALCRLATHGDAGTLPVIADLLLRIVGDLAASGEPGGPRPGNGEPKGEPVVPQEVLDAVRSQGRRLYERGRIRPSCLLGTANAQDAGHALVATMALDLLDRPELSAGEQAILLELLLRTPYAHTRSRVHRLLRHRDRHVRKHVIALLARDATGDDAQSLSASLVTLTAAQDVQTVRQALLALGQARAHWACGAVAACLDHPNMNIKKTAAGVLVRAGTPAAVPKLLFWLGHHDNPGLRATLVEALRAILGDAYAASLLAAAERAEDGRARELLLEGLSQVLPARSVLALDDQASPLVPALLTLVAAGRVGLASGTLDDLAAPLARHGITPLATRGTAPDGGADAEAGSLLTEGWNPPVALRIAERDEPPHPDRLRELRPMLADWLRLAESAPAARSRVLRLTLRLCPAPWTAGELTAFARFTRVLLDELADASGGNRDDLLTVLEAVADVLPPVERPAVVGAVRALPPTPAGEPAGERSTLTLLRRCGAVLVRADLEQALAAARLGADPWRAETAVLRDAFAIPQPPAPAGAGAGAGAGAAWRTALDATVRTPSTLAEFRRRDGGAVDSRDRLAALVDVYPTAPPEVRVALLDWMAALQPLDAPPWTITETAGTPAPAPRVTRADDLDQPRSAALRTRLLAMLQAATPGHRNTAALALSKWPEPEIRLSVLRAFLHDRVDIPVGVDLCRALRALGGSELRADGIRRDRVVLAAGYLDPWDLGPLVPLLLEWWEHGPPALRSAIESSALARVPSDVLAEGLGDRLDAGAWGFLDLILGRPLPRTPALERTCRRLRAEGRDDLADGLRLVDGPLRGPDADREDAAALAALRDRSAAVSAIAGHRPSRQELLHLARTGTPEQVRRALTRLAEEHRGPTAGQDPGLRSLIGELLNHPEPKVRLHAHRTSRAMLDRQTYLRHTSTLLDDPRPDVKRMAIRTLCHAAWAPAVPAVIGMLEHPRPAVRRTAAEGLIRMGASAVPALRRAAVHARPDKRSLYTDVLRQIKAATDR
ncbi:HEAT repeat domain-containing protein [Streptomyces sp. NPDC052236]|uniref:HEAT repeat domain-containing protein n=1 Tax=Streptomyces sp. NPDC052236 TaxID=3365686 RepID=UPI0037D7F54E